LRAKRREELTKAEKLFQSALNGEKDLLQEMKNVRGGEDTGRNPT
jgi:hypothetical protein